MTAEKTSRMMRSVILNTESFVVGDDGAAELPQAEHQLDREGEGVFQHGLAVAGEARIVDEADDHAGLLPPCVHELSVGDGDAEPHCVAVGAGDGGGIAGWMQRAFVALLEPAHDVGGDGGE